MKKVTGTASICFPWELSSITPKTPKDNEKKFSHFDFKALRVILHTLTILIVLICCHGNLLFPVCRVIFGSGKIKKLE